MNRIKQIFKDVADAIREMNPDAGTMTPNGFAESIKAIPQSTADTKYGTVFKDEEGNILQSSSEPISLAQPVFREILDYEPVKEEMGVWWNITNAATNAQQFEVHHMTFHVGCDVDFAIKGNRNRFAHSSTYHLFPEEIGLQDNPSLDDAINLADYGLEIEYRQNPKSTYLAGIFIFGKVNLPVGKYVLRTYNGENWYQYSSIKVTILPPIQPACRPVPVWDKELIGIGEDTEYRIASRTYQLGKPLDEIMCGNIKVINPPEYQMTSPYIPHVISFYVSKKEYTYGYWIVPERSRIIIANFTQNCIYTAYRLVRDENSDWALEQLKKSSQKGAASGTSFQSVYHYSYATSDASGSVKSGDYPVLTIDGYTDFKPGDVLFFKIWARDATFTGDTYNMSLYLYQTYAWDETIALEKP